MPPIGEMLREARMRQRLDIADVEERTKIRAKYLRALENEDFEMLPGPTFVKTFLRTYAELLGLDPHPLVEQYRAGYEPRDELEQLQPIGPPGGPRERRIRPGRPGGGALLVLGVVAVLVLLLVLGITGGGDGDGERAAGTETQPQRERKQPSERREPKPPPTAVRVRVAPTFPTYVCLDTGEGTEVTFEGTLDAARTFRGERLRVNLGKTSVEVRVNGRPVPIEPGPDPVGFELTPTETRPLPVGERPCA